jgi:uncharacterized protein (DUF488 family)
VGPVRITASGVEMTITIATIGYERATIAGVMATLIDTGIEVLVDVRELPLSRNRPFSKRNLRQHVEGASLIYMHFRELGDPKEGRNAAKAGDYGLFQQIYAERLQQPAARSALDQLTHLARSKGICLLCFERDAAYCHRSIVANEIAGRLNMSVTHLEATRDAERSPSRHRESPRSGEGPAARW